MVTCKEITEAQQRGRVNLDSELSLLLLNVFPIARCEAKWSPPPRNNDKETSFLGVDWTNMYSEDAFFGPVRHKRQGNKLYESGEMIDFVLQGDEFFWQGGMCILGCLIDQYFKSWNPNETSHTHSWVLEQELRHRVYSKNLRGACDRVANRCKQFTSSFPRNQKE